MMMQTEQDKAFTQAAQRGMANRKKLHRRVERAEARLALADKLAKAVEVLLDRAKHAESPAPYMFDDAQDKADAALAAYREASK